MSTEIATVSSPAGTAGATRFANPLEQIGTIMTQPAVKRSLPLLFMLGLIAAAALAWSMLATPPQRILFTNLPDADKAAVTQALSAANISNGIDASGSVTVAEDDYHRARMLLASQDLPKGNPGGYAILDQLPMGVSRAVEGERLRQARESEIARSIQEIDAVAEARVHLAAPEASAFVREQAAPSASVIVKLQPGRTLADAQVRSIVNLVAASVPGMRADNVTIVDQMGALLSNRDGQSAGDARIDFQRRVEEKYRQQLAQLLTPLVGAGNFTAEIQADVNLDESQATRETYDREGGVIRAEQGSWTGAPRDANAAAAPGGIPGALSNVPPPSATAQAANPATPAAAPAATTPGAQPANGAPPVVAPTGPVRQTDSFARTYDRNREVSVTRAIPGDVKRISVAVLLREEAGRPRGQAEIRQITQLVQAAVGYNAARQDQVTVISRKFTPEVTAAAEGPAWYEAGWFALVARNVTALLIALLVLFLGVRPLAKALLKKRDDTPAAARPGLAMGTGPAASLGAAAANPALSYEQRVGAVRGFARDNPGHAAAAVRDMINTGDGR